VNQWSLGTSGFACWPPVVGTPAVQAGIGEELDKLRVVRLVLCLDPHLLRPEADDLGGLLRLATVHRRPPDFEYAPPPCRMPQDPSRILGHLAEALDLALGHARLAPRYYPRGETLLELAPVSRVESASGDADSEAANYADSLENGEWSHLDSNQGPPACEAGALTS
jgi:hypothetical protein